MTAAPSESRPLGLIVLANGRMRVAALLFLLLCVAALLAPLLAPVDPYDLAGFSVLDSRLPPGSSGTSGLVHLFGTDVQGRDILSAVLYGLRISLAVGIASSVLAMLVGTGLGLLAGYLGGWVDALVMRIVDLQLAIPAILIALVMLATLGRGPDKLVIALAAAQWVYYARTVRGAVLVESTKDYVSACRIMGYGRLRILLRQILPNVLPIVTSIATVSFAAAIALEATLSFLGVGMPITEPSLGLLIANGFSRLMNGEYWISLFPGLTLLATVLTLNIVGDELQDTLNPLRR